MHIGLDGVVDIDEDRYLIHELHDTAQARNVWIFADQQRVSQEQVISPIVDALYAGFDEIKQADMPDVYSHYQYVGLMMVHFHRRQVNRLSTVADKQRAVEVCDEFQRALLNL